MSAPRILVTGASGKTGGAVADLLLQQGADVRALVHRRDPRAERLAARGAQVVVADVFDPLQMRDALEGIAGVYFVPPWQPYMLQAAVVLATEAHRAGVETVVHLSQWLANPSHPSLATRQNWLAERLFDLAPLAAHVTVNPGFFADNYLGNGLTAFAAQLGVLPVPMGDSRNAPPSNEDIARVVVGALSEPGRHTGRTYRPTGPDLLDGSQMARILGDALGRKVRHVDMPMFMFLRALRVMGPRAGIGRSQIAEIRWYYDEHKLGTWEVGAPTTHVRDVAGVEPEDFATIAARYAQAPEAQRTPGNLARALWDFARIGVVPAPRLDAHVRLLQQPIPPHPELSARSSLWESEHDHGAGARRLSPTA